MSIVRIEFHLKVMWYKFSVDATNQPCEQRLSRWTQGKLDWIENVDNLLRLPVFTHETPLFENSLLAHRVRYKIARTKRWGLLCNSTAAVSSREFKGRSQRSSIHCWRRNSAKSTGPLQQSGEVFDVKLEKLVYGPLPKFAELRKEMKPNLVM